MKNHTVFVTMLAGSLSAIFVWWAFMVEGCGASQAATDSEHGFIHTIELSNCGQLARQAATNAGGGSKTAGGSDAGDVAAINAFRDCVKDGGL